MCIYSFTDLSFVATRRRFYMTRYIRGFIIAICLGLFFTSCSTITIRDQGVDKVDSDPNWKESKSFFLGGLIGKHRVNVSEICQGGSAKQLQTQFSFLDILFRTITFGIYTPRTAKVWCN